MCLTRLADFEVPDHGFGWKALKRVNNFFGWVYRLPRADKEGWRTAKGSWKQTYNGEDYIPGFHICKTELGAHGFTSSFDRVYRVEYREVLSTGYVDRIKIIVARRMRVLDARGEPII